MGTHLCAAWDPFAQREARQAPNTLQLSPLFCARNPTLGVLRTSTTSGPVTSHHRCRVLRRLIPINEPARGTSQPDAVPRLRLRLLAIPSTRLRSQVAVTRGGHNKQRTNEACAASSDAPVFRRPRYEPYAEVWIKHNQFGATAAVRRGCLRTSRQTWLRACCIILVETTCGKRSGLNPGT